MTNNTLEAFLSDLKLVIATENKETEILKRVVPLAQNMSKSADWLEDKYYRCDENTGYGVTVLLEEQNLS